MRSLVSPWPSLPLLALGLALLAGGARGAQGRGDFTDASVTDVPLNRQSEQLLAVSQSLDSVDTERALAAARQARSAARTVHDELMADARIATLLRRHGEFAEALLTARTALERSTELRDDVARAELLLAFARANWGAGDYPGAMAAHQELITLATKLGNRLLVGRGHLGLSVIYGELKDRAKAREEEQIALTIAREIGDRELESDALNNLGNNYRHTFEYDRARAAHQQALEIRAAIGNQRGVGDSHVNLSEIACETRDFKTSLDHAEQALAIYQKLGLPRYVANAHLQIAATLRASGRNDEALARLRTGFAIAEPLGSTSLLVSYYGEFAALAKARGDWQAAYEAEAKRAAAADEVLGERSRQQMTALNARYEADRRRQEIVLLRGEQARQVAELRSKEAELNTSTTALERSNVMRFALGICLLALAAVLGAIIVIQRIRIRMERKVREEARAAQQAAEQADRVKTRFLGIASHDIRAPLGNIINLTAELRRTAARDGLSAERCDLIGSEAQRVICLVEDLITTAALESGKLELRVAPMDFAKVTRDVVESLRRQADAKRQKIKIEIPSDVAGTIVGDAARLHQVVANLLSNAIKFSPPGETIDLTLTRGENTINLAVRDRGAGIPEKDIPRLFAPFERLATHPTAGESSHGLGLSIAQEIVRRHGGSIQVESHPGQGATFTIVLPADPILALAQR